MKRISFILQPIVIFVIAQLAWVSLLGIWIYWYVNNYFIFTTVEDKISPQLIDKNTNIVALVTGLVLLVAILAGMYLIFIYLNRQIKLTSLYDNFIANVTHELKSPLASIQLHLETLLLRDLPKGKQVQFISLMQKDATRLKQLIDTILEIATLEQKKIAYDFQIYNADDIIRSIVAESAEQFLLPVNSVQIHGNAPCQCVADRNAFKIVIDNLIDNAIKYSKSPVNINIKLSHDTNNWTIAFSDHGIGLERLDQKKVFQKFQRIYHRAMPNVKGTGLGLYWVRQITRYHGGSVNVYSEGVGYGTTFIMTFPVYPKAKRRYMESLLKLTTLRKQGMNIQDEHDINPHQEIQS